MKHILLSVFILIGLAAGTAWAKSPDQIEVYFGTKSAPPGWEAKPFRVITSVSGEAKSNQDAVKKIKKAAAKEDADAVIGIECVANSHRGYVMGSMKTTIYCSGGAIKFTNPTK